MSDPHLHATRLVLRPQLPRREPPATILAGEDGGTGCGLLADLVQSEEGYREADIEKTRNPHQERSMEREGRPKDEKHPAEVDRRNPEHRGKAPQIAPRIGAARPVHSPPIRKALLKVEGGRPMVRLISTSTTAPWRG